MPRDRRRDIDAGYTVHETIAESRVFEIPYIKPP
jgi:hypothetical protein